MKRLTIYTLFLIFCTFCSAQPALTSAQRFMQKKRGNSLPRLDCRMKSTNATLFNDSEGRFVLVSNDGKTVLGYGDNSATEVPTVIKAMMRQTVPSSKAFTTAIVSPMLTTKHSYNEPYNAYCPYYMDDDSTMSEVRCRVGCVATALEQILTYYRRDVVLLDTLHGWTTRHYTIDDILPGTTVGTKNIRDIYTTADTDEDVHPVAQLGYICAVAARMNFGVTESGASVWRLEEPLKRAFGMKYVHYMDSYQYDTRDWYRIIESELKAGRPVFYAGYTTDINGHAFVIDGLDADGLFHVNWGYGGNFDGYFRLDALNYLFQGNDVGELAISKGYFCNQQAILLCPDSVDTALPDTLARDSLDIVVDSVVFSQPPVTNALTPITVYLRNTTDNYLTTPYEFFTNELADTAFFKQAHYYKLSGISLPPKATGKISIQVKFDTCGVRMFRMSPDDEHIPYECIIDVAEQEQPEVTVVNPTITFPDPFSATFSVSFSNKSTSARFGEMMIYSLADPAAPSRDIRSEYEDVYVAAGDATNGEVTFNNLVPGQTYIIRIRQNWPVIYETTFTMPVVEGIDDVSSETESDLPVRWYTIEGRQVAAPTATGIYIRRQGKTSRKIVVTR
ncbi:hypothetical protein C7Y71_008955 [Pseudoprevotella muciniphila]|uniref:Spi protease inhibitor domain-containing protein n=1 Tax=Pseudoprevotella muciniphila TaxID=2133944 RepID=A0A5P8E7W6_9BACT|nr:C10 family peptidase [Pseudoprevotella muciniphila]QFQ13129.1 hypothetical protein C7Y71_008955 [Pseudoprevotella muciniphila]